MALLDDTRRADETMRTRVDAGVRRKTRRLTRALAVGLVAWWLVAWAAAAFLAAGAESSSVAHADAVVVLAGSSTYVERARLAAEVFKQGRAPIVMLTDDGQRGGWSKEEERNPRFVELAASELKARGVPEGSLEVVPGTVSSTFEEAQRVREYAGARGLRSILVVTSAYQTRRARWTFGRVFGAGPVSVSFESVPPGDETPTPMTWWLHAEGWRMVAGEYVKMIYYFVEH
jgi:uncharacterized SAM-binding protein YcdF (DUF218 family)